MSDPRRAGVLLHPTSLPGAQGAGAFGAGADAFLAFMAAAGAAVWQVLPLGPVGPERSPYRALSVFAGGEHLIDLREARALAGLPHRRSAARPGPRLRLLRATAGDVLRHAPAPVRKALADFMQREHDWLQPWCAFRLLQRHFGNRAWPTWPAPWCRGGAQAVAAVSRAAPEAMRREAVVQFLFDHQWCALRARAARIGVALFGDLAMFPSPDSAEVWHRQELFLLDAAGRPAVSAGAPPDAFSDVGQDWACAVYDWPRMAGEGFAWWRRRVEVQRRRFDFLRLDHFRGLEGWWAIPVGASANRGQWRPGPGAALLAVLVEAAGGTPLVAEDLGTLTPAVDSLRADFALPGTRVLQFAFDADPASSHLPHRHASGDVACTGTHDTDTLLGWWRGLDRAGRDRVRDALGLSGEVGVDALCGALLASPATLAILPMQDVLGLDGRARMNRPGHATGQWRWRLRRDQLGPAPARALRRLLAATGRLRPSVPACDRGDAGC